MEQLEAQLKSLNTKLQQLLKQNQLLQKENIAARKEISVLKTELGKKSETVIAIQQQLDILKLNTGVLDEGEKQELKKRIDLYLAEIDKCLALINE